MGRKKKTHKECKRCNETWRVQDISKRGLCIACRVWLAIGKEMRVWYRMTDREEKKGENTPTELNTDRPGKVPAPPDLRIVKGGRKNEGMEGFQCRGTDDKN